MRALLKGHLNLRVGQRDEGRGVDEIPETIGTISGVFAC